MSTRTLLSLGMAWSLLGTMASAQSHQPSLAEVARQEAARRKAVEASKKVYTNKDVDQGRPITTAAAKTAAVAGDPAPDQAPQAEGAPAPAATPGASASPDPQLARLRAGLALVNSAAAEAMGAIDKSNAVLLALSDENQRNAATTARDAQLVELRRLQAEIASLTKQIDEAAAGARAPDKVKQE